MSEELQGAPAPETQTPIETMDEGFVDSTGADEGTRNDGQSIETKSNEGQEDDFGVDLSKLDWEDLPGIIRPKVEAKIKEVEKQFKSAYTKKAMSFGEEKKRLSSEAAQLKAESEQFMREAVEALRDPTKYEHWRQHYGLGGPQSQAQPTELPIDPNNPPETVGDLLNAVRAMTAAELAQYKHQLLNDVTGQLEYAKTRDRWGSALDRWRQDPAFKKYEKIVTTMAQTEPKYRQKYLGNNEWEVLGDVFEDFKSMLRGDLDAAKNAGLGAIERKRKGTTVSPAKTTSTITDSTPSDRPLTADEVIARARARLGEG